MCSDTFISIEIETESLNGGLVGKMNEGIARSINGLMAVRKDGLMTGRSDQNLIG